MTLADVLVFGFCICLCICWIIYTIKEIKKYRRQAPDGKVFVKEFVEMAGDIYEAILKLQLDRNIDFIISHINGYTFKVRVEKETPYDGLEYETIPMYRSYAVYIDDEVVCRAHIINKYCKDKAFIEFSSKRNRDEVIEIFQYAHVVANEHNHEYVKKWFSKYDSKSFYSEDKK